MTITKSLTQEQFLTAIEDDSTALAEAARGRLDKPVPSCPGWNASDLVVHTGVIHRRKIMVIRDGLSDRETTVTQPDGDVIEWFIEGAAELVRTLRAAEPDDHAWSWYPPDQTVGFWIRRMAHETLVHRVDAELAAGRLTGSDPSLAADGVDEALTVFIARHPEWATLTPGDSVVKLSANNRNWYVREASYSGITRSGREISDVPAVVLEDSAVDWKCEVSGEAGALDLWLWGRGPLSDLNVAGDRAAAEYLRNVAASST